MTILYAEARALDVKPHPWVHPLPAIVDAVKTRVKIWVFRIDDLVRKPTAGVLSTSNRNDVSRRTGAEFDVLRAHGVE